MAFTYNFCDGTNDRIDFARLLISDTVDQNHVFENSEIEGAYRIQANQFQSSQFYSGRAGQNNFPSSPVSYLRVAALLLDSIASNKSRLSSIIELLDVKLSPDKAAAALRDQAKAYRETDDDAGAFVIIEQVQYQDTASFKQRWFSTFQRAASGVNVS